MQVPLTPQLLGDLIEYGYVFLLANTSKNTSHNEPATIILKPVRENPILPDLPAGYDTYYRITQEPLQMLCGIENTTILVDLDIDNSKVPSIEGLMDDSYFRMSEDFFRQVIESLEDYAVFTTNRNGDVTSWNRGAENVMGYSENEILGVNSKIFFTEEDMEKGEDKKELENAWNNGRAIDERFHVRKDGSRFWGSGLVFPLIDHHQKHRGFTKIMRNLEERKAAEQEGI